MATSTIRTTSGTRLRVDVTPADQIDRCTPCRVTYHEGDWYCSHVAERRGHSIALLTDRDTPAYM